MLYSESGKSLILKYFNPNCPFLQINYFLTTTCLGLHLKVDCGETAKFVFHSVCSITEINMIAFVNLTVEL